MTLHYRPQHIKSKRSVMITCLQLCGLIVAGMTITYFCVSFFSNLSGPHAIPFIAADNSQPIKSKPDQSLNPRLPHADKMIYNEIDNQAVPFDQAPPNMLDLPEDPIIQNDVLPIVGSNNDINENGVSE